MTFEPWKEDGILLRLEHIFEKNEDPVYSKPVKINLKDTFLNLPFNEIRETNLAANQWIGDMKRLKFRSSLNPESKLEEDNILVESKQEIVGDLSNRSGRRIDNDSVDVRNYSDYFPKYKSRNLRDPEDYEVTINPMEIKTLILINNN